MTCVSRNWFSSVHGGLGVECIVYCFSLSKSNKVRSLKVLTYLNWCKMSFSKKAVFIPRFRVVFVKCGNVASCHWNVNVHFAYLHIDLVSQFFNPWFWVVMWNVATCIIRHFQLWISTMLTVWFGFRVPVLPRFGLFWEIWQRPISAWQPILRPFSDCQ